MHQSRRERSDSSARRESFVDQVNVRKIIAGEVNVWKVASLPIAPGEVLSEPMPDQEELKHRVADARLEKLIHQVRFPLECKFQKQFSFVRKFQK